MSGVRAVLACAVVLMFGWVLVGPQAASAQEGASAPQAAAACTLPSDGVVFDAATGFRWETAMQTAALLDLINHLRCQAGLPAVTREPRLDDAAGRHARYQVVHGVTAHAESASQGGFSGASAHDRIRAAGFPAAGSGEVISRTYPLAVESFAGLSSAVYHRLVMLGSGYANVGIASERDPSGMAVTVIDFAARTWTAPGDRLIVYPGSGQQAVPASVDPASEMPRPAAGPGLAGYPVSAQSDAGSVLRVASFELRATDSGRVVPSVVHVASADAGTDAAFQADAHLAANESFLLPAQPLDPGTEYEARVAGTVDGRAVSRTWRFRTRPAAALAIAIAQRAEVAAGQYLRIRLAGCNASLGWSRTANLEVSIWSADWMQVRAVSAGRGMVRVRDACGRAQAVAVNVRQT